MSADALANLAGIGQLKSESPTAAEFAGLLTSAQKRLADARNPALAYESRFDLAYGAAHALALAALRLKGYRSENRYTVFQALVHTVSGTDAVTVRILAKCHSARNLAEYEGQMDGDERLLEELIRCTTALEHAVSALDRPA